MSIEYQKLNIKIYPVSTRNEVSSIVNNNWTIKVKVPNDEANDIIIKLISQELNVSTSHIRIITEYLDTRVVEVR